MHPREGKRTKDNTAPMMGVKLYMAISKARANLEADVNLTITPLILEKKTVHVRRFAYRLYLPSPQVRDTGHVKVLPAIVLEEPNALEDFCHEAHALVFDCNTLLRLIRHDHDKDALQRHTNDEDGQADQGRVTKLINVQLSSQCLRLSNAPCLSGVRVQGRTWGGWVREEKGPDKLSTCIGAIQRLWKVFRNLWRGMKKRLDLLRAIRRKHLQIRRVRRNHGHNLPDTMFVSRFSREPD